MTHLLSLQRREAKSSNVEMTEPLDIPAAEHDAGVGMRAVRQQQMTNFVGHHEAQRIDVAAVVVERDHPQAVVEHVSDAALHALRRARGHADSVLRRRHPCRHGWVEHDDDYTGGRVARLAVYDGENAAAGGGRFVIF